MLTPLHKQVSLDRFLDIESRLQQMESMLAHQARRYPLNKREPRRHSDPVGACLSTR